MKKIIHRANSRAYFDHGWLQTYHTFSFARYYDPLRVHFGALRVLNDDTVAPGKGFDTHPHDNMEIVSIPLSGVLEHGDSMGNNGCRLHTGQIQVMSAGTGILHSEFNGSETEPVQFLQIWVFSDRPGYEPRYENITLGETEPGRLQLIVTPESERVPGAGWIHQKAWFYLATLNEGQSVSHVMHSPTDGAYVFVIEGDVMVADEKLGRRDGMGISGVGQIDISAASDARILLMEVPMAL